METPQSLWQPLPVFGHPQNFSFSLYLIRISHLLTWACCLPSRTSKRSLTDQKISKSVQFINARTWTNKADNCHGHHEYADNDRQTFVMVFLRFHLTISHCNCLLSCAKLFLFSLWDSLGIFVSLTYLAAVSLQTPAHWKTPLFFFTSQLFIKQVHSGHSLSPPAVASIMPQLPGFTRLFLITLPWHFHTHEHSKVFHKETLKYFCHPVGSKLFSLLNRPLYYNSINLWKWSFKTVLISF